MRDSIKKISLKSSQQNKWDFLKLGPIFEEHSLYSFIDNNNNQVNIVELNLLNKFTESLPFSPFRSLKRESGKKILKQAKKRGALSCLLYTSPSPRDS